jgi:hypothetical protein
MRFIDTHFPLIVVVRERSLDQQELEQLFGGFERYFEREQNYAVLSAALTEATAPDAVARAQVVNWLREPRVSRLSRSLCMGLASVVARDWEQHALTAIKWAWSPAMAHQAVSTVADGVSFCVSQLTTRHVPLPRDPALFTADISRTRGLLSLAGQSTEAAADAPDSGKEPAPFSQPRLRTLSDDEGSVVMGWVGARAVWASFTGRLTAGLGARYAMELTTLLQSASKVHLFIDASALESYELNARAFTLRALEVHRRRFSSVLMLNWSDEVSEVGKALVAAWQGTLQITTQRIMFERQLSALAPQAPKILASQRAASPMTPHLQRPPGRRLSLAQRGAPPEGAGHAPPIATHSASARRARRASARLGRLYRP